MQTKSKIMLDISEHLIFKNANRTLGKLFLFLVATVSDFNASISLLVLMAAEKHHQRATFVVDICGF